MGKRAQSQRHGELFTILVRKPSWIGAAHVRDNETDVQVAPVSWPTRIRPRALGDATSARKTWLTIEHADSAKRPHATGAAAVSFRALFSSAWDTSVRVEVRVMSREHSRFERSASAWQADTQHIFAPLGVTLRAASSTRDAPHAGASAF